MSEQLSLDGEPGWHHDDRGAEVVVLRPELQLVWRGLVIVVSEGQLSRAEADQMLRGWDEGEPDEAA